MNKSDSLSRELLAHFLKRDPRIESRIADGIENNRKGKARLHFVDDSGMPVSNVRVSVRQVRHDFLFGANIFQLGGFSTGQENQAYEQAFLKVFNAAVVPFYWSDLEPAQGRPRFEAGSPPIARRPPPDVVLDFCERHGLVTKGHCLAWHQWLPSWLPAEPAAAGRLLTKRIREIGDRYGDRIPQWDVVNEPMEKYLFPKVTMLPDDYVAASLRTAGKSFPADAVLFVNEATTFSWREFHGSTTGYHLLLENLRNQGVRVDGIGLQYHLFFYNEQGLTATVADLVRNRDVYLDPSRLFEVLDLHGRHGLPVHISEITLPTYPDLPDAAEFQARLLRELYRLWFSHPAMEAIYWWNLNDGSAHGAEGDLRGGLLDSKLNPKPAYEALRQLVTEEWTTRFETEADATCEFRGFHGNYEVTTEYRGHRIVHPIAIHRNEPSEFRLQVQSTSNPAARSAAETPAPQPIHALVK